MSAIAAGLAVGITGFLARDTYNSVKHSRVLVRNFYGALRVYDEPSDGSWGTVRVLRHGTIDHGEQFLAPQHERFATTYYSTNSGVGLAIQKLQTDGPMNVGVIGLGAGTLATYGRPIDHYTFYDINPLVPGIAHTQFRFLRRLHGRRTKWCWAMRACRSNANSRSSSMCWRWTRFRAMRFRCIC